MTKIMGERLKPVVVGITCDRCKKVYDDQMEMQEFLSWKTTGGYGNRVFGDLTGIEIDLCQYCTKETLGEWIRLYKPFSQEELIKALSGESFKL